MLNQLAADVAELEPKAESWEAVHELTDPWSGIHTWGDEIINEGVDLVLHQIREIAGDDCHCCRCREA